MYLRRVASAVPALSVPFFSSILRLPVAMESLGGRRWVARPPETPLPAAALWISEHAH